MTWWDMAGGWEGKIMWVGYEWAGQGGLEKRGGAGMCVCVCVCGGDTSGWDTSWRDMNG